jgi:hypothetical protein
MTNHSHPLVTVLVLLLSGVFYTATAQVALCLTVEDCIQESPLTCQEWIDSMESWDGECCSFQDVTEDSEVQCRLTIVGSCRWIDPLLACAPDATICIYGGTVYEVVDTNETCPESVYSPFQGLEAPTAAPIDNRDTVAPTEVMGVPYVNETETPALDSPLPSNESDSSNASTQTSSGPGICTRRNALASFVSAAVLYTFLN